jgi:hypothetical protein
MRRGTYHGAAALASTWRRRRLVIALVTAVVILLSATAFVSLENVHLFERAVGSTAAYAANAPLLRSKHGVS